MRLRFRTRTFQARGVTLPYFVHSYNATWRNERIIEIPIAQRFLRDRPGPGLEVGNVLSRYQPVNHTVVDKYEQAPGVLNIDVIKFRPPTRLDWILAISTLEHVGRDETPQHFAKAAAAIRHLQSLLAPDGRLLLTVPRGYNPSLDDLMINGSDALRETFMVRVGRSEWAEEPLEIGRKHRPQRQPSYNRNIWIAEYGAA